MIAYADTCYGISAIYEHIIAGYKLSMRLYIVHGKICVWYQFAAKVDSIKFLNLSRVQCHRVKISFMFVYVVKCLVIYNPIRAGLNINIQSIRNKTCVFIL